MARKFFKFSGDNLLKFDEDDNDGRNFAIFGFCLKRFCCWVDRAGSVFRSHTWSRVAGSFFFHLVFDILYTWTRCCRCCEAGITWWQKTVSDKQHGSHVLGLFRKTKRNEIASIKHGRCDSCDVRSVMRLVLVSNRSELHHEGSRSAVYTPRQCLREDVLTYEWGKKNWLCEDRREASCAQSSGLMLTCGSPVGWLLISHRVTRNCTVCRVHATSEIRTAIIVMPKGGTTRGMLRKRARSNGKRIANCSLPPSVYGCNHCSRWFLMICLGLFKAAIQAYFKGKVVGYEL